MMQPTFRHYGALLSLLFLAGCGGSNVVTKGTFPDPLVNQLPLHMGVHYSDEFRNYTYQEKEQGTGKVSISTGATQTELFETIFRNYFSRLTHLDELPGDGEAVPEIDGIIAPELEELQFAVPSQTKSKVYEVWMKFKIGLYDSTGAPVSNWTISAYGKTPKRFMKTRTIALERAAIVALRDAGAHFITRFERLPTVKDWLADNDSDIVVDPQATAD